MKKQHCLLATIALLLSAAVATANESQLFAVEVRTGPNWDVAKAPHQQAFFADHSAHLRQLRDRGVIVMGARYSDIGLLIFDAESADAVTALMQEDPSMTAGTFTFSVHSFSVFFPGTLQ